MTTRARYERLKIGFLIARATKTAKGAEQREKQKRIINEDKLFLRIVEASKEIIWTEKGHIDPAWIQNLIETEFDASVGITKARTLGKRAMLKFHLEKPVASKQ